MTKVLYAYDVNVFTFHDGSGRCKYSFRVCADNDAEADRLAKAKCNQLCENDFISDEFHYNVSRSDGSY